MKEIVELRQALRLQGKMSCRIVSDSMDPLLSVNDRIQIIPFEKAEDLKRFDLLVFHEGDHLMCHFLWTVNRVGAAPTITTRSLKRPYTDDPPVPLDRILGVVISHRVSFRHRVSVLLKNLLRGTS